MVGATATGGAVVGGGGGTVVGGGGTVVVVIGGIAVVGAGVLVVVCACVCLRAVAWELDLSPRLRNRLPTTRAAITAVRIPRRLVT